VRKGGWVPLLYEHSLAIAFFRFIFRLMGAARCGWCEGVQKEQVQHGEAAVSMWRYVTTSQFWFESMQNWQSEFIEPPRV
jgi:hypothetical protein